MNDQTAVNVTLYVDGCLKIFKGYRVESANRSFKSTNGYTGSKEVRFFTQFSCGAIVHVVVPARVNTTFFSIKESGPRL